MKTIDVEAILNNDYDVFRNDFYETLKQKYDSNPIIIEFNKRLKSNDKIHEFVKEIKGNIKHDSNGLLGPAKQMLLDNKN